MLTTGIGAKAMYKLQNEKVPKMLVVGLVILNISVSIDRPPGRSLVV